MPTPWGTVSALVFGTGMCLAMKVIGPGSVGSFAVGVVLGIVGMMGVAVNYPLHKELLERGKQKYAFEIIELAKEISENNAG